MQKYWIGLFLFVMASAGVACDSGGPDAPETVRREMVLFASDRGGGGNMNIWMMTPEGEDLRQITYYTEGDFWPADISPDGKRLLFYRLDDYTLISGIYLMDLDGPVPGPDSSLVQGLSIASSFFPDGERFLFDRFTWTTDTTGNQALFIYDLRDGSQEQISPPGEAMAFSEVSPDGEQICFSALSGVTRYSTQVFIMNVDGTGRRALSPAESPYEAPYFGRLCAFSPDGGRVFFELSKDLYWTDLATGEMRGIKRPGYETEPYPDQTGERLFFRSGGGDRPSAESEIYVINLDGSGLTRLTDDGFRDDKLVVAVVEFEK